GVRAAADGDPQRGHDRAVRRRGPPARPAALRGPLVRPAGADAARRAAALGRGGGQRRGDGRAAARRRLHDPRHAGRRAVLQHRAALDGAERNPVHGVRPDRPARGEDQRHHRRAADPRRAGVRAVTLWAGRVEGKLAPEAWAFLLADDAELLPYDVEATLLHAERLHAAGILDDDELSEVAEGLAAIDHVDPADEDVHSSIERQLGAVGRKIHAGRSRNDQVAAAFRLYVADACKGADAAVVSLAQVVLERAGAEAETPMPGYTHLQRAQPVTLGHHLLAGVEMLERDRARVAFAA